MSEEIEQRLAQGKDALDRQHYDDAFAYIYPCAQAGDAEAQSIVGFLYYLGAGVSRDLNEAIRWLTSAAEQGRGEAAHNLGTLYLSCEPDMPNNPGLAEKWYTKAKDLGFVVAPEEWYSDIKR